MVICLMLSNQDPPRARVFFQSLWKHRIFYNLSGDPFHNPKAGLSWCRLSRTFLQDASRILHRALQIKGVWGESSFFIVEMFKYIFQSWLSIWKEMVHGRLFETIHTDSHNYTVVTYESVSVPMNSILQCVVYRNKYDVKCTVRHNTICWPLTD